jgi:hypothetical protein
VGDGISGIGSLLATLLLAPEQAGERAAHLSLEGDNPVLSRLFTAIVPRIARPVTRSAEKGAHIAIQEESGGKSAEWMEPVSDDQYQGAR